MGKAQDFLDSVKAQRLSARAIINERARLAAGKTSTFTASTQAILARVRAEYANGQRIVSDGKEV